MIAVVLALALVAAVYFSREYFENPESISPENARAIAANAPDAIPPVDQNGVAIVKQGLINVIQKRPDVVNALQDVFADPEINPTIQKIFNPSPMPSTTTQLLQSYLTTPNLTTQVPQVQVQAPTCSQAQAPTCSQAPAEQCDCADS